MIREYLEGGKVVGHPIEAATKEEALKIFEEKLPGIQKNRDEELARREVEDFLHPAEKVPVGDGRDFKIPIPDAKLNGRKFLALEFQCSACGAALEAVFKDGFLQIAPCPTCLGELENMIAAVKRFLDRKNGK
jgi:hypothetical protein